MNANAELLDAVQQVRKLSAETRLHLLARAKRSKMPRDIKDMVADVLAYPAIVESVLVEMIAEA